MFSEIVKTECEQAKVFWEEYYKHVNKAHFSDGSDFDQTVMRPGTLFQSRRRQSDDPRS